MDKWTRIPSLTICWIALIICPVAAVFCARETDLIAAAVLIFASAMAGAIARTIGGLERL